MTIIAVVPEKLGMTKPPRNIPSHSGGQQTPSAQSQPETSPKGEKPN